MSINNGQHFDSDFPKETVYPSIKAARDGINKWATTRNGTFSVIVGKSYKSQMPSGESGTTRVDIHCSRSGVYKGRGEGKRTTFTKKCNCPWRLCVVLLEGVEPFETVWMPLFMYPKSGKFACSDSHGGTHSLGFNVIDHLVDPGNRVIPPEAVDNIDVLVKSGSSAMRIYNFLIEYYVDRNESAKFTKRDIINYVARLRQTERSKLLDASDLIQYLLQREKSLYHAFERDDERKLKNIFFETSDCLDNDVDFKVMSFDTKHGSNIYGLYLGLFTSVDKEGKSRIVGVTLTASQDTITFQWCFELAKKCFGNPVVFFSDSDHAIGAAVSIVWTSTVHLLCVFHIFKKKFENVSPLLRGCGGEDRQIVFRFFWKLAKESDEYFQKEFNREFDVMSSNIIEIAENNNINDVSYVEYFLFISIIF